MNEKIFEYFRTANAGWYICKDYFFDIKETLLKTYGESNGWDIRIYHDEKYFIKRYLLNGQLFHVLYPGVTPEFGFKYKKVYRSRIHREDIPPEESYKALFVLLLLFDPMKFSELMSTQIIAVKHWSVTGDEVVEEFNKLKYHRGQVVVPGGYRIDNNIVLVGS
jgi:hypothetical protein